MVQKLQKRKSSGVKAFLSSSTKSLIEAAEKANSPTIVKKQSSHNTFELRNILMRRKSSKEKEKFTGAGVLGDIKFNIEIKKRRDCPKLPAPKLKSKSNKFCKSERLFDAVLDNDINLIRKLIVVDEMNVNEFNHEGNSVLHVASATGNTDCINMLLECGAAVNAKDSFSRTPLEYAVLYGNFDCATLLLDFGADADVIKDGMS